MGAESCSPAGGRSVCDVNMGVIHLQAGDLVSAYRFFQPSGEAGDPTSIEFLIEICERAGDSARAEQWRSRMPRDSADV